MIPRASSFLSTSTIIHALCSPSMHPHSARVRKWDPVRKKISTVRVHSVTSLGCGTSMKKRGMGKSPDQLFAFCSVPKTEAVPIGVLDVEVATPIGLVTNISHNLDALGLELRVERVGVLDPDMRVPRSALGIDQVVRSLDARLLELRQHDDDAVAPNHAE